jgi:hypothetical protein
MPSRNFRPSDPMKKTKKPATEEGPQETSDAFRQWCALHGLSTDDALRENKVRITVQENGDVSMVFPATLKAPSIRDTALALRAQGKKGIPLHDDGEALEGRHTDAVDAVLADHALLALELLEAIHRGDPAPLRAIADAMKKADKAEVEPVVRDPIHKAVTLAARKAGRVPTEEQAQEAHVAIEREAQGGATPKGGAFDRSDKFHEKLEVRGIDLEKENGRGDHLRRKSPK